MVSMGGQFEGKGAYTRRTGVPEGPDHARAPHVSFRRRLMVDGRPSAAAWPCRAAARPRPEAPRGDMSQVTNRDAWAIGAPRRAAPRARVGLQHNSVRCAGGCSKTPPPLTALSAHASHPQHTPDPPPGHRHSRSTRAGRIARHGAARRAHRRHARGRIASCLLSLCNARTPQAVAPPPSPRRKTRRRRPIAPGVTIHAIALGERANRRIGAPLEGDGAWRTLCAPRHFPSCLFAPSCRACAPP